MHLSEEPVYLPGTLGAHHFCFLLLLSVNVFVITGLDALWSTDLVLPFTLGCFYFLASISERASFQTSATPSRMNASPSIYCLRLRLYRIVLVFDDWPSGWVIALNCFRQCFVRGLRRAELQMLLLIFTCSSFGVHRGFKLSVFLLGCLGLCQIRRSDSC